VYGQFGDRYCVVWSTCKADTVVDAVRSTTHDKQSCSSYLVRNRLSYSIQIGRGAVDSVFDFQFNLDRVGGGGGSVTGAIGLQTLHHGQNFTSVIYSHSQQKLF
jgi:hypothetical protein